MPAGKMVERATMALSQLDWLVDKALTALRVSVARDSETTANLLTQNQLAVHAFAWLATYRSALSQLLEWAKTLLANDGFGPLEAAILETGFGEYLAHIVGGIPIAQAEFARLEDLGIDGSSVQAFRSGIVDDMIARGASAQRKAEVATFLREALNGRGFGDTGLHDQTTAMLRAEIGRYVDRRIAPFAHGWHQKNELIPRETINELARLGVFGISVDEAFGGLGLGKLAMCVVTEELSRGYLSVGSLGTRSEIACELIAIGGTAEQKALWLPQIANGEVLATAVFTEPGAGSDLGSLQTRADHGAAEYRLTGNKTWITHAARADLMVVLARTDIRSVDYRGLSIFLAPKTPANDTHLFPDAGIEGTEIGVLGYRGMREYELRFDGFVVSEDGLLGAQEGQGFGHLMATFESARIQTAARAVGVAQNAMELALRYALDRRQFGKALAEFPRIAARIGWMAVETMIARQLTYFSARQKDAGRRCDVEAGMAKLLAARVAWSNADNALQIHGGNGYSLEYDIGRVLCDARILNIFEGAAEIQAQIVTRGLLGDGGRGRNGTE